MKQKENWKRNKYLLWFTRKIMLILKKLKERKVIVDYLKDKTMNLYKNN